jgi:hypothetical protein
MISIIKNKVYRVIDGKAFSALWDSVKGELMDAKNAKAAAALHRDYASKRKYDRKLRQLEASVYQTALEQGIIEYLKPSDEVTNERSKHQA